MGLILQGAGGKVEDKAQYFPPFDLHTESIRVRKSGRRSKGASKVASGGVAIGRSLRWRGLHWEAGRDAVGSHSSPNASLNETSWAVDCPANSVFERAKCAGCSTADFRCLTGNL